MTILRLNLTIIFIFLLTITAFAQVQVKKVNLKKIEFSSQTRGYQELIGIDKNSMDIKQTGTTSREEHLKLSKKDWQIFKNIVQQIDLRKIDKLNPPSKGNLSDAGHASHFTITTSKGRYESIVFDNYNAPNELKPLLKKMLLCAKIKK
jgi:heat shock protein HslJ